MSRHIALTFSTILVLSSTACFETKPTVPSTNAPDERSHQTKPITEANRIISQGAVAKATPKPGKANIQGKVVYDLKPAAGVQVKLCVERNMYADCIGEKHLTKTDDAGEYIFTDLEPKEYNTLFVRVFDTDNWIFSGKDGGLTAQKIKPEPDTTFFVPLTSLFKTDLKVLVPTKSSKISGDDLTFKWEAYPNAKYYVLELLNFGTKTYPLNKVFVSDTSYVVPANLPAGGYRLKIEVLNAAGEKIAQAKNGIEFSIVDRP